MAKRCGESLQCSCTFPATCDCRQLVIVLLICRFINSSTVQNQSINCGHSTCTQCDSTGMNAHTHACAHTTRTAQPHQWLLQTAHHTGVCCTVHTSAIYLVTGETGKSGGFSAGSGMRKGWFSRDQLSIVSNAMFGTDALAIFRAKMGLEGVSPLQLDTQEPCATTAGLR